MEKLQQKQSFRMWLERQFSCVQEKILRAMYQIAPIFAEKKESSKKANVSRGSNDVLYFSVEGAIGKLQIVSVFLEHQFRL